jgi:GNAT superfamily N-acetyltransferase
MNRSTIRDKKGQDWMLEIDEQLSDDLLIPTLVYFYVFHSTNISRKSRHPVGNVYVSIHNKDKTIAKVEDIEVNPKMENMGIGSSLLKFIEEWTSNRGIRRLIGDLSNIDIGHLDKLKHIYEKRGYIFTLSPTGDKKSSVFIGKVEKVIDNLIQ